MNNYSNIYPYKPCPKCGSTNLGFGSGIDLIVALCYQQPEKALAYTYTICNDCNFKIYTNQLNKSDTEYYNRNIQEWNQVKEEKKSMFNKFLNLFTKTVYEKDNLNKKGRCFLCPNEDDEPLFDLFGIEVCEGCYHDLLNHMSYKNFNDLMDCDKQQLMKFLNKLVSKKNNKKSIGN